MFECQIEAVEAHATSVTDAERGAAKCFEIARSQGLEPAGPAQGDRAQTSFASVAEHELGALRRLLG